MQRDSDSTTQGADFIVSNIHTVDAHAAFRYIIKTGNQIDQRGLSAAGRTHYGNGFARIDGEIDMFQHRFLAAGVGKGNVYKFDVALCVYYFCCVF